MIHCKGQWEYGWAVQLFVEFREVCVCVGEGGWGGREGLKHDSKVAYAPLV